MEVEKLQAEFKKMTEVTGSNLVVEMRVVQRQWSDSRRTQYGWG